MAEIATNPTLDKACAPTVPEVNVDAPLNIKFSINENFDVPVFLLEKTKIFQFERGGRKKLERKIMKHIMKSIPRKFGAIIPEFIDKYKLSSDTKHKATSVC